MAFGPIAIHGKQVSIHKAIINPDFASRTVLVTDTWDYVSMWLRRKHKEESLFFWEQAHHFYQATQRLPITSSPLTAYYCFLNAVMALLTINGIGASEQHGLTGKSLPGKVSLSKEVTTFLGNGVASALCQYLKESVTREEYTLKDLLYNLPYTRSCSGG